MRPAMFSVAYRAVPRACFNPADDFLQLRPELCFSLTVQAGHGRFDLRHQFKGFPAITEFYFGAVGIKVPHPVMLISGSENIEKESECVSLPGLR